MCARGVTEEDEASAQREHGQALQECFNLLPLCMAVLNDRSGKTQLCSPTEQLVRIIQIFAPMSALSSTLLGASRRVRPK